MDRFIEVYPFHTIFAVEHLKSNMDRFIGIKTAAKWGTAMVFKIQYG